jgi:hypothetical protein
MPDPIRCLLAVLAAAGVSAFGVLVFGWPKRPANGSRQNVACLVGIGLGLVSGYAVLRFELKWPPASALDRLLTIVIPAVFVVEAVAAIATLPRWVAALFRGGLALATGRILLHGSIYLKTAANAADGQLFLTLGLAGALLAGVWGLLIWLDRRTPGVSIPLALAMSLVCGGLAVMLAGYISGGEASLPPAAAVGSAGLVWAAFGRGQPANATISVGVVTLFALLFIGRFFGALPIWQAVVVFLAPLLCGTGELPPLRQQKPWFAATVRLVLVAVPLFVVLLFAKRSFDGKMAPLLTVAAPPTCIGPAARL